MAAIAPTPVVDSSSSSSCHVYALVPANPLLQVDLPRTLAKQLLPPAAYRAVLSLMLRCFHVLAWNYRFDVLCFAGILFVDEGPL